MSLEQKIETLTVSINKLIEVMDALTLPNTMKTELTGSPIMVAPVVAANPVSAVPVAPVVVAPGMPAPPTFAAPSAPPAPVVAALPFADGKGLIDYVMKSYQQLGAQKGAGIQNVMTQLGYSNINDIRPEHYAALYQGVEQLKAQP